MVLSVQMLPLANGNGTLWLRLAIVRSLEGSAKEASRSPSGQMRRFCRERAVSGLAPTTVLLNVVSAFAYGPAGDMGKIERGRRLMRPYSFSCLCSSEAPLQVLRIGWRGPLKINATVNAAGIAQMKQVLGKYEVVPMLIQ